MSDAAHALPAGAVLLTGALAALALVFSPAGLPLVLFALLTSAFGLALARLAQAAFPSGREWLGLAGLALTAWLLNAIFLAGPRASIGGHAMPWSEAGARAGVDTALRLVALVLVFRGVTRAISARQALAMAGRAPGGSLGILLLVALRLAPTLGVEARRLQVQRALRGEWPGPQAPRAERERRLRMGVRDLAQVTLPLFLLTLTRAEELAWALPARYYGVAPRTPPPGEQWTGRDWAVVAMGTALAAGAAWARWGT